MANVESLRLISDLYGYYAGLFNLIVGLSGNTLIIWIFTRVKIFRGNPSSFYFTVESLSNLGLLLTIYSSSIYQIITNEDPTLIFILWCKIRMTLAQIFGVSTLISICYSTIDQYFSTNHRYSFRQISSLKLAQRMIFISILIVVCHSVLFLIFTEIRSTMGCTVYQAIVKKYYSFFYYPVLSMALPFIVTISFSLLSYDNVHRIVRRQIPIVRRRLDQQMTSLVLARVISIVICGLPYIFITLYSLNVEDTEENQMDLAILGLVGAILYSLLYTNFAINFYLFLLVSSRFRRQVKNFFWKTTKHRTGRLNQIVPERVQGVVSIVEPV